jgi:hypothetical protein
MKFKDELIIKADVLTKNNTLYSKEVCEKIVEQINERKCIGVCGSVNLLPEYSKNALPEVNLRMVSIKVDNAKMKDDEVLADITVLEGTPQGDMLKSMIEMMGKDAFIFRPQALVSYKDEEGPIKEIDSFKLVSINVLPKEQDSLGE